jgi:hypothetical protein
MEANLAYGESGAVVKFMVDTYGSEAMSKLLSIFGEGALYDEAFQQAIGVDTDGLDNAFRASLGLPPLPGTEAAASTQGGVTVAEGEKNSEEAKVAEPAATPIPKVEAAAPVEPTATATVAPTVPEKTSNPISFLPCVGGMILLLMGGLVYSRSRLG